MTSSVQKARRKQLDQQLSRIAGVIPPVPRRGWVRALRTALGMTMRQLAHRMGSTSPSAVASIEAAEVTGGITMRRLQAAADALDCDLVYVLVPRGGSVTALLERRAEVVAARLAEKADEHMRLEGQAVSPQFLDDQVRELARELLAADGSELWNPEPG